MGIDGRRFDSENGNRTGPAGSKVEDLAVADRLLVKTAEMPPNWLVKSRFSLKSVGIRNLPRPRFRVHSTRFGAGYHATTNYSF